MDVLGAVYIADTANSRVISLMMSAVGFGELQVGASSARSLILPFTVSGAATLGGVQALTLGAPSLDFTLGSGTTCSNGTTNTTCEIEVQFLPLASGLRRGGVALFDQGGSLLATVPIYGTGAAPFATLSPGAASIVSTGGVSLGSPFSATSDGAGNIYVGNYAGNNVVKIAAGGGSASVISTGGLTLIEAAGVAVDGAGNLYIADYGHNRIVLVTSTGTASVVSITGVGGIKQPAGLALDAAGNLYIADWGNNRVVKITPAGAGSVVATGSYSLNTFAITGVAVDLKGNVYIADRAANHIVKVTASGAASLVTLAGLTLATPQGVAVDGNGNLYIADSDDRRVVELTTAGIASVVQTPGQTIGSSVYGITVDANGDIVVGDWSNNRVMKIRVSGASLSYANTRIGSTSVDSPKTATVTNLGNEALVFSADPSYTPDFPENTVDTNRCSSGTSLDPGQVCDVSVLFTPQSVGSLSTNLVLTNNHLNGSNVTENVAVSGTGLSSFTPTIAWAQPSAIVYGTPLGTVLSATARDGSAAVAGTFLYTATPQGGTASAVTSATVLGAGDYTLSVSFTPSNTTTYTSATESVTLTVDKLSPSIALASSTNPALVSSSVTLTASVSSSINSPTGSVEFYDGTTRLGSGTLASGAATYTTSSLASGTHTVTAVYAGNSNFSSVTSSALSQLVSDLSVGVASGGTSTAIVSAGGTATYHLTIAPSAGSAFPARVTLSASGAPAGSTVTITPQTIAAGAVATNVTLTIQVPAASASLRGSSAWALGVAFPLMGMFVVPFGVEGKRLTLKRMLLGALLLLLLISIEAMVGCGSDSHRSPPPAQPSTYTIAVTAASGSLSHSTTVTLTVE